MSSARLARGYDNAADGGSIVAGVSLEWIDERHVKFPCKLHGNGCVGAAAKIGGAWAFRCDNGGSSVELSATVNGALNGSSAGPSPHVESPGGEAYHDGQAAGHPPKKKSPSSKYAHAIAYARKGIKVFPLHEIESDRECSCGKLSCDSAGKHPRMSGWQAAATCDEDQIKDWWREWPNANIGVKCGAESNLTVLDVDGDEGRESLRALELEHGELPETPIALTGRGGAHYLFAFEPGLQNAVKFTKGLDVRTEGGLIVGVGSKTVGPYLWEAAFTLGDVALAQMPEWLANQIRAAGPSAQRNGSLVVPERIPAGERNNWLYKTARSLKAKGLSAQAIESAVLSENAVKCVPPMPPDEVRAIVAHATSQPDQKAFQTSELVPYAAPNKAVSKYAVGAGAPALASLRIYSADEFFAATEYLDSIEWVWDRIFPAVGLVGVFGDPEAGKSTFCRTLALAVSRGEACLGRDTKESRVLYLDLADEQLSHRRAFKNLGWTRGNMDLVSQDSLIGNPNALDLVEAAIKQLGSKVVIVDMMADLLTFKDLNDYANAKEALRGLRMLSRETNALFVVLHHTPKALGPDADVLKAGLGSQAIVGSFDLRIAIRRRGKDMSTIIMSNGKVGGEPLTVEHALARDSQTEWIGLGHPWTAARSDYYAEKIYQHFKEAGPEERMTSASIAEVLDLNPGFIRSSLRSLFRDGRLARDGEGKPHKPFYYRLPDWTPEKDKRIVDD
jgi:hypothetical protein